jgi:hypothetical protein
MNAEQIHLALSILAFRRIGAHGTAAALEIWLQESLTRTN